MLNAQSTIVKGKYRNPLDIPMYMSGSFGELRSNHFHSGIDIKTQGTSGHKVYAIADGWVSRIKISPWGYGKSVYIQHPDGTTSVYAHLDRFASPLRKWILDYQYQKHTFAFNTYLQPNQIKIKKGDLIAYSGNTGGSAGPHLHFEMRETQSQSPINPMPFGFKIKDNIAPEIKALVLFKNEKRKYITPKKQGKDYWIKDTLIVKQGTRFGFISKDYSNGSRNTLGVNHVQLFYKDSLIYEYNNPKFSFAQSRYINALIDYEEKQKHKKVIQKLYIEAGNQLALYNRNLPNFSFIPQKTYPLLLKIEDANGNMSQLHFTVCFSKKTLEPEHHSESEKLLKFNQNNTLNINNKASIFIPKGALYKDEYCSTTVNKETEFPHNESYNILPFYIPLHKKAIIEIKAQEALKYPTEKYLISRWEEGERKACLSTQFKEGKWQANTRNFGTFKVELDTTPPQIQFLKQNKYAILFKVTDDLSGLKKYNAFIDKQWVLLEYDPKKERLIYYFDEYLKSKNSSKTFKIKVSDEAGNTYTYSKQLFF